jgi:hypothetical protein
VDVAILMYYMCVCMYACMHASVCVIRWILFFKFLTPYCTSIPADYPSWRVPPYLQHLSLSPCCIKRRRRHTLLKTHGLNARFLPQDTQTWKAKHHCYKFFTTSTSNT